MSVSYRQLRNDFHTHEKTAGLSPFARDLFLQCMSANIIGALQRSVRAMSRTGCMRESDVRRAIPELVSRGICKWYEQDEVLWLVECADEQVKNSKAWVSAKAVYLTLPRAVQEDFKVRYAAKLGIGSAIPYPVPSAAVEKPSPASQEQEQEQEQEAGEARAHGIPDQLLLEDIVEAVNRPRRRRGLKTTSPLALSSIEHPGWYALARIFARATAAETLTAIEHAQESWLATATNWEVSAGHPVGRWLKCPDEGTVRAAQFCPKPTPPKPMYRDLTKGA